MLHMSAFAALVFLPIAGPVAIWVAWNDMKFMKIPNKAVLTVLIGFALLGLLVLPLQDYAWRWLQFGGVLIAGWAMTMVRLVGAGDAKFAAAMAPFVAYGDFLFVIYLFSAVLLAAFVSHRLLRAWPPFRRASPDWESWRRRDFPMGLALGGTLLFYLMIAVRYGA
ncbi:MAG: prepilin peptidase CpaA [Paracoccaceae bacterium]|jgi:prepilin peptidase CpaA